MVKFSHSLSLVTLMAIAIGVSSWEPPKLPAGRRLQYYILHPEGDYVFGYDTGEGSNHAAKSDTTNRVRGHYQYGGKAASGRLDYSYTGGFAVPGADDAGDAGSFGVKNSFGSEASYESGPADASYSFSYDAADHSRQESSDAAGNVRGSFAFTAKDGIGRKVDYEAGAEKGFIATGAHLPVAPEAVSSIPTAVFGSSSAVGKEASTEFGSYQGRTSDTDASYSFSYDAGDHSRSENADKAGNVRGRFAFVAKDGVERQVEYEAGAEKGFLAKGSHLPTVDAPGAPAAPLAAFKAPQQITLASPANIDGSRNDDGSYSFSYNAGDHSRQESADAAGNVRGRFSFVAKDGVNRKVDYEAGAEKGFIAKGAHIPVAPETTGVVGPISTPISYYAPKPIIPISSIGSDSDSTGDRSYSFSYNAGDHSRQESVDPAGNVRGQFSFVAKDGINRQVDYEAGAEKGFVAKGAHIPATLETTGVVTPIATPTSYYAPKAVIPVSYPGSDSGSPIDGSYSFSYDASDHSRQESADAAGNVRGHFSFVAKDGVNRKVDYEAGADKGFVAKGAHIPAAPETTGFISSIATPISYHSPKPVIPVSSTISDSKSPVDGSYSFSYDAGDHSRLESADSAGNVRGHFSFVAKDGVNRKVDYEAGAEKGFIAKGAHIPVAPETTGVVSIPISYYAPKPIIPVSSIGSDSDSTGDRSYSFSYNAGDHSRQESADPAGNVRGQFSFVAKDGINRQVDYEAGAEKGFVAKGAHIPFDTSLEFKTATGTSGVAPSLPFYHKATAYNPAFPSASITSTAPVDGTYSFSYDAHDHSRQESSDASGNVKGNYRFVAKDGINRKVEYEAGAEKGFIAKGEHLPASALVGGTDELAYKYSYETDSSKKTETSDAYGNVLGSFSYIGPDGVTRKVDYRAGGQDGFVLTRENLQPTISPASKQSPGFAISSSSFTSSSNPSSPTAVSAGIFASSQPSSFITATNTYSNYQNSKTNPLQSTPYSVRTFLPHQSPTKFGYIYDTQV